MSPGLWRLRKAPVEVAAGAGAGLGEGYCADRHAIPEPCDRADAAAMALQRLKGSVESYC